MLPVTSFVEEEGTLTNSSRCHHVEVEGGRSVRRVAHGHRDPGRPLPAHPQALRGGGRHGRRAADGDRLELRRPGAAERRRAAAGAQRQGAGGSDATPKARSPARPASSSPASARCATTARPTASSGSTPASTGRTATSRSGGTTPTRRASASTAAGASPGRPTGASSTTAPRPIPQGKPWSEREEVHRTGTAQRWTGAGRAGLTSPTIPPDRATGPFIMNPEGVSRLWVRGHDGGRSVPGALRAVRVAGGQPAVPEGPGQPGGAGVRRRHGDLRQRRGVPDRRHHLPADRAFPLLDQERAHRTRCCSPSSSWRCPSSWRRRRASSTGSWSGSGRTAARSRAGRW